MLDVARELIDGRGNAGYPYAKEELRLKYHDLFQNHFSAMRLLQNRYDHLFQVKAHKSVLHESRQDLTTLIDNAYYASYSENYILRVESMITQIDSSITSMSKRLNSIADYDDDLVEQDNLLIKKETPKIVRSLRTRISHL